MRGGALSRRSRPGREPLRLAGQPAKSFAAAGLGKPCATPARPVCESAPVRDPTPNREKAIEVIGEIDVCRGVAIGAGRDPTPNKVFLPNQRGLTLLPRVPLRGRFTMLAGADDDVLATPGDEHVACCDIGEIAAVQPIGVEPFRRLFRIGEIAAKGAQSSCCRPHATVAPTS